MNNERLCDHTLFMRSILVDVSPKDGHASRNVNTSFVWTPHFAQILCKRIFLLFIASPLPPEVIQILWIHLCSCQMS